MESDSELSAAPSSTINNYFQKTPSVLSAPARRTRNFYSKRLVIPPKQKKAPIQSTVQQSKSASQLLTKRPRLNTSQTSLLSATLPAKYIGGDFDHDDDLYEDPDDVSDAGALTDTDSNPFSTLATASSSAYKRLLTSGIYEHFTYIVDSVTGLKRYKCKHCSTTYAYGSGTTTLRNHLKKEHKIDVSDRNTSKQGVYNQNIATALSRQPALDEDWKNRQIAEHLAQSVDKKCYE